MVMSPNSVVTGPVLPAPGPDPEPFVARAAGEIHNEMFRVAAKMWVQKDPAKSARNGIAELFTRGLISQAEAGQLGQIIDIVSAQGNPAQTVAKVRAIHDAIVDQRSTNTAIGIS